MKCVILPYGNVSQNSVNKSMLYKESSNSVAVKNYTTESLFVWCKIYFYKCC